MASGVQSVQKGKETGTGRVREEGQRREVRGALGEVEHYLLEDHHGTGGAEQCERLPREHRVHDAANGGRQYRLERALANCK